MLRKSPFLLFEILVALSLMGVLLSILFSFMVQSIRVDKKVEKARSSILQRQNLQVRLSDILTTLTPADDSPSLFTQKFPRQEKESLIAVFDNGIDPDPAFSGTVIGRVYLDENKNLCLAYWPSQKTEQHRPWRKEILISNISDYSFAFLKSSQGEKAPSLWENSWPKKHIQSPSLVRLILKQNDRTLQFAFRLVHTHSIPTWVRAA